MYVETQCENAQQVVGDLFGQHLMGIGDLLGKPREYSRHYWQCFKSGGDILNQI